MTVQISTAKLDHDSVEAKADSVHSGGLADDLQAKVAEPARIGVAG